MTRRGNFPVVAFVVLSLLAAACGDGDAGETTTAAPTTTATGPTTTAAGDGMLPMVDPLDVTGDIVTAGSSTVFPLSEATVARFIDEGYGGQITIDSIGSGAGFERFCETGETDVSNSSRPIKDSEVESCRVIGREPI